MRHASFPATLLWGAILSFIFSCGNNASAGKDGYVTPVTGSGSDMYYEFSIVGGSTAFSLNGSEKLYFASGGKIRSEMQMTNSANKGPATAPIVLIGDMSKPHESIEIDDDKKTYTINHIDDSISAPGGMGIESTVLKVGEEEMAGFHCIHARIISIKDLRFMKQTDTIDLWRSTSVPIDPLFIRRMDLLEARTGNFTFNPKAAAQLKQMGCQGFPVQTQMRGNHSNMNMQLTKVERRSFPNSLFEIPAGYKEDKNGL